MLTVNAKKGIAAISQGNCKQYGVGNKLTMNKRVEKQLNKEDKQRFEPMI